MVITYYIELFHTGAGKHNGTLMSLCLLVAETTSYRPINLLLIISKMFEKIFYEQLETVANEIFYSNYAGLEKGTLGRMLF